MTLKKFLQSAPKKLVATLHKDLSIERKGVVKSSEAVDQVSSHWIQKNKNLDTFLTLPPLQHNLLFRIYLSENRGQSESELYLYFNNTNIENLRIALNQLQSELWIFAREEDSPRYFGFQEFRDKLVPYFMTNLPSLDEPKSPKMDFQYFAARHLVHFFSQVKLGNLKTTVDYELHRKDTQFLLRQFSYSSHISTSAPQSELRFLYHFSARQGWIGVSGNKLILKENALGWLNKSLDDLERDWCQIWQSQLYQSKLFSALSEKIIPASTLSEITQIFSKNPSPSILGKPGPLTWDQLGQPLQEMWLLGLVQFYLGKGKIQGAKIINDRLYGKSKQQSKTPPPPKSHSNFEFYLNPITPPKITFLAGIFSEKQNDDPLTLYRFTKNSVIAGLQANLSQKDLLDLCRYLKLNPNVQLSIDEWIDSYRVCEFSDVSILRVRKKETLKLLTALPALQPFIKEEIPGFGFILNSEHKKAAEHILKDLGFHPKLEEIRSGHDETKSIPLPYVPTFEEGEIVYNFLDKFRTKRVLRNSKYGQKTSIPALADKLKVIEHAMLTDQLLEISFANANRKRITVRPIHLEKMENPITLIGVEMTSGHRKEFHVEDFISLRTVE